MPGGRPLVASSSTGEVELGLKQGAAAMLGGPEGGGLLRARECTSSFRRFQHRTYGVYLVPSQAR